MAEGAMKYHVGATRDGDGWMADVPALPGAHTWAKTLRALDRNVREVIGMVEDLPRSAEAALDLEMDYHTGDPVLDERAGRLRARRREQERAAAEIVARPPRLDPLRDLLPGRLRPVSELVEVLRVGGCLGPEAERCGPFGSRVGLASGRLTLCRKSQ